ncbi:hypothetical protein F4780DRAFT_96296 [Xylariomycetidae sp. FL0641]|nr:hypothetical protein F4780DRAFT_96296 [Xylariomycetidae sp. FL0641]
MSRALNGYDFSFPEASNVAWRWSVNALRGLCKGTLPCEVAEAVLMVGLVKSMCAILDMDGLEYEQEFIDDLGRWQVLFANGPEGIQDLKDFELSIMIVWHIDITAKDSSTSDAYSLATALYRFQDDVSSLMKRANQLVCALGIDLAQEADPQKAQIPWLTADDQAMTTGPSPETCRRAETFGPDDVISRMAGHFPVPEKPPDIPPWPYELLCPIGSSATPILPSR